MNKIVKLPVQYIIAFADLPAKSKSIMTYVLRHFNTKTNEIILDYKGYAISTDKPLSQSDFYRERKKLITGGFILKTTRRNDYILNRTINKIKQPFIIATTDEDDIL